jgi:hypothetical protein
MHTIGLILTIFGGVIVFASALGLSCSKTGDKISGAEAFDVFVLGGFITFCRDLFRAIAEGLRNRASATFPLLLLLGCGIGLLILGSFLMRFAGGR